MSFARLDLPMDLGQASLYKKKVAPAARFFVALVLVFGHLPLPAVDCANLSHTLTSTMHAKDWLLAALGIFLPFVPVAIKRGVLSADFWINIALCFLGFIPALIHSWYIISCYPYETSSTYAGVTLPGREPSGYGAVSV